MKKTHAKFGCEIGESRRDTDIERTKVDNTLELLRDCKLITFPAYVPAR